MLKISVFIPTFNAEKWLDSCLQSIYTQDYPTNKVEVIIVDGGSNDKTEDRANQYPVKFIKNPKRLAHYAFSIYGKKANCDIVVMFAADNELVGNDWFLTVNECFQNYLELAATWGRQVSGEKDRTINKYFALIQSEPLSFFVNRNIEYYMREGKSITIRNKDGKLFNVNPKRPLVWGANGLSLRFDFVKKLFLIDSFIGDNDIFQNMIEEGHNCVAYIPSLNVIHHHVNSVEEWYQKIKRNYVQHFLEHREQRNMRWAFDHNFFKRLFLWSLYAGIPIFSGIHATWLMLRDRNICWIYHPFLSLIQLFTYVRLTVFTKKGRSFIKQIILK